MRIPWWQATRPKAGDIIISVDCRGCMAHDHVLKEIGLVGKVISQRELYGKHADDIPVAVCTAVESQEDIPPKQYTVIVDYTLQLSKVARNIWFSRR